jgi:hypothetical protein
MSGTFATKPVRQIIYAATAGLISLAAMTSPASAGFLDFLFTPAGTSIAEPSEPPALLIRPRATPAPAVKLRITRPQVKSKSLIVEAEPAKVKSDPCCKPGEDPVAYLMHDETLRPGDAVMTPDGIRIFEGPISSHHGESDFAPLAKVRNIAPSSRAELAQVDVRAGEALPAETQMLAARAPVQTPVKPQALAQASNEQSSKDLRRLAMADQLNPLTVQYEAWQPKLP